MTERHGFRRFDPVLGQQRKVKYRKRRVNEALFWGNTKAPESLEKDEMGPESVAFVSVKMWMIDISKKEPLKGACKAFEYFQ